MLNLDTNMGNYALCSKKSLITNSLAKPYLGSDRKLVNITARISKLKTSKKMERENLLKNAI
ncbi:hypothetical protein KCTC52924_02714 [Arenibacter antarcticus]|nr:hypothetical protein [Arenibacter sp. H213]